MYNKKCPCPKGTFLFGHFVQLGQILKNKKNSQFISCEFFYFSTNFLGQKNFKMLSYYTKLVNNLFISVEYYFFIEREVSMFLFISNFILICFILFLWMLLVATSKFKSDEEKFIEDNLQMQYLRKFSMKKKA